MELNLDGKTALVTGASKGIGRAIKQSLVKEGVKVYSVSRSDNLDLMDYEGMTYVLENIHRFDILINNVGGCGTCDFPDWRIAMEKNYGLSNKLTMGYLMTKRKWGRVITISSIYGKEKGPNPWFTAAKAAQIAFNKSMAGRYEGITFNTICPGHIDVGKTFPYEPEAVGKPEDVANLVTYLCSDKADHINGACITVDGGESYSF